MRSTSKLSRWRRRASFAIGATLFLGVVAILALWLAQPSTRTLALRSAHDWARLEPPPSSAAALTFRTTGNMFTRGYVITFTAPTADVDAWLASSPGVRDAVVKAEGESRRYVIKPGGGAAFAAVVIDGSTHVTIRTYWS